MRALENRGITKEKFIELCENNSTLEVMNLLNLHKNTFIKYAKIFNCYFPNQGGRGKSKNIPPKKFDIEKWNNNELINVSRATLRKWIFKLNLLPKKCNKCKLSKWNNLDIPLELNHIDGKGNNNIKLNIELLCPNCHAQTPTYRGKNQYSSNKKGKKKYKWKRPSNIRSRKQFNIDRRRKKEEEYKNIIIKIKNSNINLNERGWRVKVAEFTKKSPQYSEKFIKKFIPELL